MESRLPTGLERSSQPLFVCEHIDADAGANENTGVDIAAEFAILLTDAW